MNKSKLGSAIALALGASLVTTNASAQLEEIVVTATKRAESSQDIPVAIQALSAEALEDLGVATFDEYVKYLPNVTAQGRGPGRNEIYIRGVASEQSNNTVSSVQGSAPTVALYLDEQPVAFGGRNLDVYAADLQRVEVLPGPQGTLFGASSQAGTVRLITNKPSTESFDASVRAGYAVTSGGDPSNNLEAAINIPLSDTVAFRGVVYSDTQGGWIDNVSTTFNSNDRVLADVFNRNQAFANISDDAIIADTNNAGVVQRNWNDAQYTGARLGVSWEINEDWGLVVQHTDQDLSTEGSFEYSPTAGGTSSSQSFSPERNDDKFGLTTWTLEGRLGALDVVYTGGFLSRETDTLLDYTLYSFTGGYQNYYISTNLAAYGDGGQDQIFDLRKQFVDNTENERTTHELRFQGEIGERFDFTVGGFVDDVETNSQGQFQYFGARFPGINGGNGINTGVRPAGLARGINNVNARNSPTIFVNDFTREEDQTAFFADATFEITDAFSISAGARYYDIDFALLGATGGSFGGCQSGPDLSTLPLLQPGQVASGASAIVRPDGTLGCASNAGNNVTSRLEALGGGTLDSIGGFFGDPQSVLDAVAAGNLDISTINDDGSSSISDTIYRFTADLKLGDDALLFATFSEGFRPQTLNRNAGQGATNQTGPFANFLVPAVVETDELTNFEIGIKGDFLGNRLRLNATYFNSEIDDLQATRFDPSNIGILVFLENIGDAEVQGVDADFTWVPTDNLTIQGALSYVDSEITRLNGALQGIAAPVGSELPFTADFSFNLRSRYDFRLDNFGADAYVSAGFVYTGDSFANITADANFIEDQTRRIFGRGTGLTIQNLNGTFGAANQVSELDGPVFGTTTGANGQQFFQAARYVQESYSLVNVSAGIDKDNWGIELYVNNLFDEDGIVNINTFDGSPRVSVTRPRTVGLRFRWDYQ